MRRETNPKETGTMGCVMEMTWGRTTLAAQVKGWLVAEGSRGANEAGEFNSPMLFKRKKDAGGL